MRTLIQPHATASTCPISPLCASCLRDRTHAPTPKLRGAPVGSSSSAAGAVGMPSLQAAVPSQAEAGLHAPLLMLGLREASARKRATGARARLGWSRTACDTEPPSSITARVTAATLTASDTCGTCWFPDGVEPLPAGPSYRPAVGAATTAGSPTVGSGASTSPAAPVTGAGPSSLCEPAPPACSAAGCCSLPR
eukprot:scaffold7946_cov116-Isochrysis_galbana.AAC.8